jgi:hypothetical protein
LPKLPKFVSAGIENLMMEDSTISKQATQRVPEARYAYYRRCQVFRKNGEQCKAPAEKDSHICYAHAGQQALTLRRKLQLMVVLAEVARRMRTRGKPEFEVADIFMDFNAIQMTLAVMAQALIDGRIDCKTAGRLAVGLQTAAKLLRLCQRQTLTTKDTKDHEDRPKLSLNGEQRKEDNSDVIENAKVLPIVMPSRAELYGDHAHAPPGRAKAA